MIRYTTTETPSFVLVHFDLEGAITPDKLKEATNRAPDVAGKPVVLSGRGPIWLYGALIHKYLHVVPWLGVYDPKLGGAIVVASHVANVKEGDMVPVKTNTVKTPPIGGPSVKT